MLCETCNGTGVNQAKLTDCTICGGYGRYLPTLQQRLERAREEILRNQRARAVERQKELNLMTEDSKRIKELWGLVCWYVSGNPRRLLKP